MNFTFKVEPKNFWLIKRRPLDNSNEDEKVFLLSEAATGAFVDSSPTPNTHYQYVLGKALGEGFSPAAKLEVQIPFDIVIKGEITSSLVATENEIKANRLFFLEGGRLLTLGEPLTIDAREIISEKGSILTFRK